MPGNIKIAPSILAADLARLGEEITALEVAGADYIHVDVMDGHFVPVITFGSGVVKAIRPCTALPLDVHLMISPVENAVTDFADAGADIITIHAEATPHFHRVIQKIGSLGKKAGISLNPATPVEMLDNVMDMVDLILVMTVNPGFGGQKFIGSQLEKIRKIRQMIDSRDRSIELQVDGGINNKTALEVIKAGADVLVAGTATFRGGPSCYGGNIRKLRGR